MDNMLFSILNGGRLSFLQIVMNIIAVLVIVLVVLPFHELAHGYVAYKLGDDTAKRQGRLTSNPMAHLNPIGALCLFFVGFGWAEPVPVNMFKLRHPKRDMALVALAGPCANIIAALIGALLSDLWTVLLLMRFGDTMWYQAVEFFFEYYVSVNVGLAVFNLIPLPPLDGSKILGAFLPDDIYEKQLMHEQQLSWILVALIVFGIVDKIIALPETFLLTFVYFVASLPFRPFM